MTADDITISGNFDGGNPKNPDGILQSDNGTITIVPFSEDGDKNYKFRLEIIIVNHSDNPKTIKLNINWDEDRHKSLRNHLYLKYPNAKEWQYFACDDNDFNSVCSVELQPGENYVSLQPKYSYQDYINLIYNIPSKSNITAELSGVTTNGREIWCLRFKEKNLKTRKKLLVVSRIHPYETAGSYCAHGLVDLFEKPFSTDAQKILEAFDLYLIPMANPDGVYDGLCKLTSDQGINLSRQIDLTDKTCCIIKKIIDSIKPDIYVELHNWMFKDVDGICYLNFFRTLKFIYNMPSQKKYKKHWRPIFRRGILSHKPVGFKKYCKDNFASTVACFEYPWLNRSCNDMKNMGIETIKALSNI